MLGQLMQQSSRNSLTASLHLPCAAKDPHCAFSLTHSPVVVKHDTSKQTMILSQYINDMDSFAAKPKPHLAL